jgi:tetratricopeptide (TPR) repeat protein
MQKCHGSRPLLRLTQPKTCGSMCRRHSPGDSLLKQPRSLAVHSPLLLLALVWGLTVHAQGRSEPLATKKPTRAPIDSSNQVRINYGFSAWNTNPTKIDSASLLMREGATGRIVQINLQETAPDSSVFSGIFSINWRNIDKLQVEFYIPPQELLNSNDGIKKMTALIAKNELKRKPFLLRRSDTGAQNVEIFDSVEQAQAALRAYRAEVQLQATIGAKARNYPTDQEIDVAKLAQTNEDRAQAAVALAERVRMHQVEADRVKNALKDYLASSANERTAKKAQAEKLAAEGLAEFRQDHFDTASKKFGQAMVLAPDTPSYMYQHAISLYRLEHYNESLVFMQLAEGASINPVERQYYLALNYFGLRDFDNAEAAFEKVVAANDPIMSQSAQFYKGVAKFEQEDWEAAQEEFQKVLDTSKDAELDKQAESYIEQILRMKQFEGERAKKWTLSATIGEMADSNVILSSDSALDQGTASDSFGFRSLLMSSLRYRPVYDEDSEFAIQADVFTMYTRDKSFGFSQSLRNADPTVATLSAPWSHKATAFGYGYKLDLAPGYERIYMSIENDEAKLIVDSFIMNVNNLVVMNQNWFANWNVETRRDMSHLNSSTGDLDSNAYKARLVNTNTIILNSAKDKFLTAEGAFTMNQAMGRQVTYNRIDANVGYLQPFYWDTVANAKLGY